jgi:predicted RNA-binding protein with PIN domain
MERANFIGKKNKYTQIFEENLKEDIIYLANNGFLNMNENIKVLKENNNDKAKALQILSEKRKLKIDRNLKKLELYEKGDFKAIEEEKAKRKQERMERKANKNYDTKKPKREKSEKKEKRQLIDKEKLRTDLQPGLKTLILDGNNMLFADDEIRKLRLKGKKSEAEKRLVTLALEYAKSASIQELTIIFDVTKLSFDWSKDNKDNEFVKEGIVNETNNFIKLRVFSANPNFTNSDDALVTMSANYSKDELANMLFVTSDQELLRRLDEKGSHVMKTGIWFKLAKAKLGEQYDSILTK